ncbi:MAG: hypothetical protein ABSH32_19415 [Bryobacteraceae bacterium]|jgi:hypothetical protein
MDRVSALACSGAAASSTNLLCDPGKIICISKSVAHSLISNPFRLEVHVNSSDDIEVRWEIREGAGQVLESSSTYDYPDSTAGNSPPSKVFHSQDFILKPAESEHGTLILTPSRYTVREGGVDLRGFEIPVRLTTEKTLVTTLEPEDPKALHAAVIEWVEGEHHGDFDPTLKLVPHQVEVMRIDPDAVIGATVEAALRSFGGQGPWHVTHWNRDGKTAHVTIEGGGWAGVTYYLTEVSYDIRKSVLNLPRVEKFVFDQVR